MPSHEQSPPADGSPPDDGRVPIVAREAGGLEPDAALPPDFQLDGAALVALRDGSELWRADCDPEWTAARGRLGRGPSPCVAVALGASAVAALAVTGAELYVFDREDGARMHHVPLLSTYSVSANFVAWEGPRDLLIAGSRGSRSGFAMRVRLGAGESATGRGENATGHAVVWRRDFGETLRAGVTLGGLRWFRGDRGTLMALSPEDGTLRRFWGVGEGQGLRVRGALLGVVVDDTTLWLDPARASELDPVVRIHGRGSLAGAPGLRSDSDPPPFVVRAGDVHAIPSASGEFALELRARGQIWVHLETPLAQPCDRGGHVLVDTSDGSAVSITREIRRCLNR